MRSSTCRRASSRAWGSRAASPRRSFRRSATGCTATASGRDRKGGRSEQLLPRSFGRACLLAPHRRREERLRRDLAQDELVVAEQRRRDRGDHARSVERRELLLLDRAPNLLHEALADLPLRLDRRSKLSRLHRSELLDQGSSTRSRHQETPFVWNGYKADPATAVLR